ncbi:hypothetical protein C8Q79DRAFT_903844 [Trametes meyenii]|nr:hypothetical protein C8Q79DRAFT_903844 [Trametes meyenii]
MTLYNSTCELAGTWRTLGISPYGLTYFTPLPTTIRKPKLRRTVMRVTRILGVFTAAHASAGTAFAQMVERGNASLAFQVVSGGNDNYFLRDGLTSAQLLLTSANDTTITARRLVVALPAGNSGAVTYFLPKDETGRLGVTVVEGSVRSATGDHFSVGVQADLVFDGNATMGTTVIGAVRAMRDYVEGNVLHEIFNYAVASFNETTLRLHRQWINTTSPTSSAYKGADLYLSVPSGSPARLGVTPGNNAPTIDILVPAGGQDGRVTVAVMTNETSLPGLDTQRLFLPESMSGSQALQTALKGLANGQSEAAKQVSFLTYSDKFTAGGWRFLTYFGRDSLIALRLLMPILTSEAIEAALGAVIERTNATGALCHEETIGIDLGNQPFYDYKMIDTDLLLLPAISHYLLELPQGAGRAHQFLSQNATLQNGTYAEILNRTIHYNLARATPFARSPTFSNLLARRPGEPVGNWCDSDAGLAFGVYPFDVNAALVPASLRATEALLAAGLLDFAGFIASDAHAVGGVASVWEERAAGLFEVVVSARDAEARLENFVREAGLDGALRGEGGRGADVDADVSFYALSLKEDGEPVEVLNSDLGFNLAYGANVSRVFLRRVVEALQPYPRGLLTDVGMVVANPAYASNTSLIHVLDRAAYHGTVIWSFQQGLMAAGLARQLGFCEASSKDASVDTNPAPSPPPEWCSDAAFVQALRDAQTRLWASIRGASDEIFSEVWSYSFDNATGAFGVASLSSLSSTEADAVQLWSYGFLGLVDPGRGNGNGATLT